MWRSLSPPVLLALFVDANEGRALLRPLRRLPCTVYARSSAPRAAFEDADVEYVPIDLNAPPAVTTFGALGVIMPHLLDNLCGANITQPNALQCAAFAPLVAGSDALIHAHTGSGKTLAFLLPLIHQIDTTSKEPQVLVLCPSRELAFQTYRVAESLVLHSAVRVGAVAGGANPNRQVERLRKVRPQLLVGTAGRVCELSFELRKLKLQRVRHVVIDEVDEALRPPHVEPTLRLIESMRDRRKLQLVFASATADTPTVRRTALQLMEAPKLFQLGSSAEELKGLPAHIVHALCVSPPHKLLEALARLARIEPAPKALVFVNSPHRARIVSEQLRAEYGVRAASLHGKQEREERVAVMRSFVGGQLPLIVSTEMGARGLDIPSLTHVVNLELPTDEQHYVHRAGRCGRAGAAGTVLSLVAPERARIVRKLTDKLGVEVLPMHVRAGKLVRANGKRKDGANRQRAQV
eukprot:CAMPEP_0119357696 /NCGR_PEP_ID=MMETSP1334-20130426/6040_1 /TAXON_ID=127549 /ORGANISM="Calcidiscus leptoporus, Strain RCC1130" /LENGTH=464 /DNA_ID=CAMNT_0007372003 /DNA_START=13 /DNA_END=1407 /DNA_ORIENTATION=-